MSGEYEMEFQIEIKAFKLKESDKEYSYLLKHSSPITKTRDLIDALVVSLIPFVEKGDITIEELTSEIKKRYHSKLQGGQIKA